MKESEGSDLQQVDHAGHLGVNEDAMPLRLQLSQEQVQSVEFPAVRDQTLLI